MNSRSLIILATNNKKKAKELKTMLPKGVEVKTLRELSLNPKIIEDRPNFIGNAHKKIDAVFKACKATFAAEFLNQILAIVGDDSGLCVEALSGKPGVRTARLAQDHNAGEGDIANNACLLDLLKEVPQGKRQADFHCAIALHYRPFTAESEFFEALGTMKGWIATNLIGDGGFGYDPLFIPEVYPQKRAAELSAAQKSEISHRGEAMRKVAGYLKRNENLSA